MGHRDLANEKKIGCRLETWRINVCEAGSRLRETGGESGECDVRKPKE